MKLIHHLALLLTLLAVPATAQDTAAPDASAQGEAVSAEAEERPTSTLADILRRQEGLQAGDEAVRREFVGEGLDPSATAESPVGILGGSSDADLWRALRFDERATTTQVRGPETGTLIQDNGMWWLEFREGPLLHYGGYLLLGTIALLALFLLIKGRIKIEGPKTGRTIQRFKGFERFGHWLIAVSFIVLGLTGLITLMGRKFLIPAFGHDAFSTLAIASKWLHNNVAWAFMLGLVMVFVMWVAENIPGKADLKWIAKGGGFIGKGHPPAPKFNAGQKIIFWSVILLGISISISGLSLLFPFQFHLFQPTFALMNDMGLPQIFGFQPLPEQTTAYTEMMYSQLWHGIVAFVFMAIILAHIYIGTVGMEGAFEAMGSGEVEEQWAREHHSIWAEKELGRDGAGAAYKGSQPAE